MIAHGLILAASTIEVVSELPSLDDPFVIDPSLATSFRRDGHAVVCGLCSEEEIAAYRTVLTEATFRTNTESRPMDDRDTYGKAFLQTFNLWRVDERAARFTLARRFASVAAALVGVDGVRIYHDQSLFKEPYGGPTPWHQDQVYWPLPDGTTVTMWMPLVDVPAEVGSMTFASGSNNHGFLGRFAISDESEEVFAAMVRERGFELVTHGAMAAGDATFHAGWTLHSAPANPTDLMREVMTVIYVADGAHVVNVDSAERRFDLASWLPGLAEGDRVESELNPLVWPR
jgi:ectoine hydroxylase-related dioxygenase (phytanoyl-CoA dioxygenase family)